MVSVDRARSPLGVGMRRDQLIHQHLRRHVAGGEGIGDADPEEVRERPGRRDPHGGGEVDKRTERGASELCVVGRHGHEPAEVLRGEAQAVRLLRGERGELLERRQRERIKIEIEEPYLIEDRARQVREVLKAEPLLVARHVKTVVAEFQDLHVSDLERRQRGGVGGRGRDLHTALQRQA